MKITSATFTHGVVTPDGCPEPTFPEFAFIGRSNVGKSSLINMLTGKKDLARVSATPGHTRQLNFFLINEKWRLVDLPGYGYAKASAEKVEQFRELASTYLAERENLSCVFQLIDARLEPQKIDLEFSTWLGVSGIPFVLAFTKSDKLKPNKARGHVTAYLELLAETCDGEPRTFLCSAHEAYGRREILDFIDKATKAAS